jgi:hypothetical protein
MITSFPLFRILGINLYLLRIEFPKTNNGLGCEAPPHRGASGKECLFLIFRTDIGQCFIYCFRRYVQILFRVSVANITMMVRSEKDTPADKLGVEIIAFAFLGARFILPEGYEKHGRNTG